MNKMKEIAQILDVELDEEFVILGEIGKYKITEEGLMFYWGGNWVESLMGFNFLLNHEIKKPILNKQEKKYLENVLRPFKDKVERITKYGCVYAKEFCEYICIEITCDRSMLFPNFKQGQM